MWSNNLGMLEVSMKLEITNRSQHVKFVIELCGTLRGCWAIKLNSCQRYFINPSIVQWIIYQFYFYKNLHYCLPYVQVCVLHLMHKTDRNLKFPTEIFEQNTSCLSLFLNLNSKKFPLDLCVSLAKLKKLLLEFLKCLKFLFLIGEWNWCKKFFFL